MNREEIEDHLSSVVLGLNTNNVKLTQIKELDKQIAENEAQLNKSLIKIPFVHKKILDDMGIIKHHVPTLLEQNKQLVTKYNKTLKEAQQIEGQIINHLKAVIDDYSHSTGKNSHSTGKNRETKKKLIDSYFSNYSINEKLDEYDRLER